MKILLKTGIALLLCLGIVPVSLSQVTSLDTLPEQPVFGEVPDSLFLMEPTHDYPYEVLSRIIRIRFEPEDNRPVARIEFHDRIKVYDDNPSELARAALVAIPFHSGDNIEQIERIEGVTYLPDSEPVALDSRDVRYSDLNTRQRVAEFIMPNVRAGAILEYRYTIRRTYIDELPDLIVGESVPVRYLHMELNNGEFVRYQSSPSGLREEIGYFREEEERPEFPLIFTIPQPEPLLVEHWVARDLPAASEEPYGPPLPDRLGRIKFQISEFGQPRQPLLNNWDYVAARLYRTELNPFEVISANDSISSRGADLTSELTSDHEKVEKLFRYVNRAMEYNGELSPFHYVESDKVLSGEPADQASINLALLALLEGAGLNAWPVYISGRPAGSLVREFPSLFQFHQMLILAETESGFVWLDASYPESWPGLIRPESWSQVGWRLSPDDHQWVFIQPSQARFLLEIEVDAEFNRNGDLEGIVRINSDGYPAREARVYERHSESSEEVLRSLFFESYPEVVLFDSRIEEAREGSGLGFETGFRLPGYAISFEEGLQFHPVMLGYLDHNPFEGDTRKWDILLDAPEKVTMSYRIRLPDGFELNEQPASHRTGLDGAEFVEEYMATGQILEYDYRIEIDRRRFSRNDYDDLQRLYERWVYLSRDEWFIEMEAE